MCTHTQKPLPVFKVFGNSIKDTRFRIYICALLCLWPRRKRTISAQLQQRAHNKAQPSGSRMQHNWKQYPRFRHLVLKALLRGIEIWTSEGPAWRRNEALLSGCREGDTRESSFVSVGLLMSTPCLCLKNKTFSLKYALNTLLTFTPVYACS